MDFNKLRESPNWNTLSEILEKNRSGNANFELLEEVLQGLDNENEFISRLARLAETEIDFPIGGLRKKQKVTLNCREIQVCLAKMFFGMYDKQLKQSRNFYGSIEQNSPQHFFEWFNKTEFDENETKRKYIESLLTCLLNHKTQDFISFQIIRAPE